QQRRLEHRPERQFQVEAGQAGQAVLRGDDLALLGDLDPAFERPEGLSEDGLVRPAAAPADGASPAMEEAEDGAVLLDDVAELALRPVDLPLRRRDPGVLVRVRVAEHHLLPVTPQLDDAPVGRLAQQGIHDQPGLAPLADGLGEWGVADPGYAAV